MPTISMFSHLLQAGTMETIGTLVGNLGFPIAICIVMVWVIYSMNKSNKEELANMRTAHKEESDQMRNAIENNTVVMKQILEHYRDDDENNLLLHQILDKVTELKGGNNK